MLGLDQASAQSLPIQPRCQQVLAEALLLAQRVTQLL
jgi:hypothetical protein